MASASAWKSLGFSSEVAETVTGVDVSNVGGVAAVADGKRVEAGCKVGSGVMLWLNKEVGTEAGGGVVVGTGGEAGAGAVIPAGKEAGGVTRGEAGGGVIRAAGSKAGVGSVVVAVSSGAAVEVGGVDSVEAEGVEG
jgi:hypothetical protein